jgi:ABC-type nitrate/sulfonate/bicarbonate transport system permease component
MTHWRGWIVPILLVAVAEAAALATNLQSDTLAAPSRIALAAWTSIADGSALQAAAQTLLGAAGGLCIGASAGLAAGIALGLFPRLGAFAFLSIELLRPIPAIALVPLSLLMFGFGYRMEIAVVAFATFWPVLILSWHALAQIDIRLLEVAKIMKLGAFATVWKIILPATTPRLFTALRLATALALVVAVTVEVVANPQGFGHDLMLAQETLHPDRMLAMLLLLGAVGVGLNAVLLALQRRLFLHRGDIALEAGR